MEIDGDTAVVGAYRDRQLANRAGAAYVYQRNTANMNCPATGTQDPWCEEAKLIPFGATPYSDQRFGSMVAISGDTILVGANRDDALGDRAGSAYVFINVAGAWANQQKLIAPDGKAFDFFGTALAIDGDTAFIGGGSGVYVFTRSGVTWTFQEKLTPLDAVAGQNFGNVVSLSGDTLLVGAIGDDTMGADAGAAYVFARSGTSWTQQAKLLGSDSLDGDNFGAGAAVFGNTALIGAPRDSEGMATETGSAYVFTRSGTVWTQQTKLVAPGGGTQDFFGFVLALSGNTALISSDLEDGPALNSGAAYVYTGAGASWTLQARITASDAAAEDAFGWGVALDGDTAVIGAPTNSFAFPWTNRPGAAYVFSLDQDDDGIRDGLDNCPGTDDLPESVVPTRGQLHKNRWALQNGDGTFVQALPQAGSVFSFDIADTHGCTCEQIIEAAGLGIAHTRNGCSTSAMLDWISNLQ